jgi:hypothetical protein
MLPQFVTCLHPLLFYFIFFNLSMNCIFTGNLHPKVFNHTHTDVYIPVTINIYFLN